MVAGPVGRLQFTPIADCQPGRVGFVGHFSGHIERVTYGRFDEVCGTPDKRRLAGQPLSKLLACLALVIPHPAIRAVARFLRFSWSKTVADTATLVGHGFTSECKSKPDNVVEIGSAAWPAAIAKRDWYIPGEWTARARARSRRVDENTIAVLVKLAGEIQTNTVITLGVAIGSAPEVPIKGRILE